MRTMIVFLVLFIGIGLQAVGAQETPTDTPTLIPTATPTPDLRYDFRIGDEETGQDAAIVYSVDVGQIAIVALLVILILSMWFVIVLLLRQESGESEDDNDRPDSVSMRTTGSDERDL